MGSSFQAVKRQGRKVRCRTKEGKRMFRGVEEFSRAVRLDPEDCPDWNVSGFNFDLIPQSCTAQKPGYSDYPIDGPAVFYDHTWPSEVPAMATFIVSIFVVIIVGAASAFVYVLVAEKGGKTGPQSES